MARSERVRYFVRVWYDNGSASTPISWNPNPNWHGRATEANLKRYVSAFEASTLPGGCNAHHGPTKVIFASLEDSFTHTVKATYGTRPSYLGGAS